MVPNRERVNGRICHRTGKHGRCASSAVAGAGRRGFGWLGAALLLPTALLAGCGIGAVDTTAHVSLALNGTVHGGQQPVSGATIQIYSAGTTGNASPASALIPSGAYYLGGQKGCLASATVTCYTSILSDNNGNFNISGDYTCASYDSQVYIVASGGNPGLLSGTNNTALTLVAPLGNCGAAGSQNVYLDEVTTAAAAWALAPFATSPTQVGSSATNSAGIANAFLDYQLLANTATGTAATLPSNLTIETGKLYALADALAGCVNSDGSGCSTLFGAAKPSGGSMPGDTFTAALNITRNPGQNVTAVWGSIGTVPPYPTTLTQSPNDWTMSLTVTGGGLFMPAALAVDGANNVWVAGQIGPLSEFNAQGTPYNSSGFGAGTNWIEQATGIVIDSNGNVWISDYNSPYNGAGALTEFDGPTAGRYAGSVVIGTSNNPVFYDPSIQYPNGLSANTNGEVFAANNGSSSATVYQSTGAGSGGLLSQSLGINDNLDATPEAIAADSSNGFWLSDDDNTIAHIDQNGNLLAHVACCYESYGLALDSAGNVWVANFLNDSFSEVSASGTLKINQSAVGGLRRPAMVAVDAAQNVWISNFYGNSITELGGINSAAGSVGAAISPTTGVYTTGGYGLDAGLRNPFTVAPDTAGNLWVLNQGKAALTMFFGLATPTVTPVQPVPTAP